MTQTESPATSAAVPASAVLRRRPSRRWVVAGAIATVLVAGSVTGVAVSDHYLRAPALTTDGGSAGWQAPDDGRAKEIDVGDVEGSVAPVRRGQEQSFAVSLQNPSSVTQTVLGLAYSSADTSTPDRVEISADPEYRRGQDVPPRFRRGPVALPPHSDYLLRYTVRVNQCLTTEHTMTWRSLALRVRVGAFTRTETVHFGDELLFVIRGIQHSC